MGSQSRRKTLSGTSIMVRVLGGKVLEISQKKQREKKRGENDFLVS